MKRLLLLGVLSCSIALRADEGAVDVAVADDGGVSDAGELLKPIDDAAALPAVEPAEVVVEVEVAVESVEVVPEESVNVDEYDGAEADISPYVQYDANIALPVSDALMDVLSAEQEVVAAEVETSITQLLEYQCLDDLLKKESHKTGKTVIILKRLVRAGLGVATSVGLGHLIKTKASTWADKHSLPLYTGLGVLALGLYETLLYTWADNQDVYRSILGHIVHNWNVYTMLVPEDYVDTFNALHAAYVQNGNQLTVTEKEAKHIVKTMKYSVRSEIKKRQPQSHTHDKKR